MQSKCLDECLPIILLVVVFAGLGISVFIEEVISIMAASEYHGAAAVVPAYCVKLHFLRYIQFSYSWNHDYKQDKIYRLYSIVRSRG